MEEKSGEAEKERVEGRKGGCELSSTQLAGPASATGRYDVRPCRVKVSLKEKRERKSVMAMQE